MYNWFHTGPLPTNTIIGHYNFFLVALSYIIAVFASYVALDLAGRVQAEKNPRVQNYWLLGGAVAMGAGIWSMHFIGMLAFIMPMPMSYDLDWTITSLIVAMVASGLALYLLKNKYQPTIYMLAGGILIGIGIVSMHYIGMTGMSSHVNIRYIPSLFFLSIIIAIVTSEVALWLFRESNKGSLTRQFNLKFISALIMGAAICGMHYTGMAAAVFTPLEHGTESIAAINPYLLALLVALVTSLIIGLALTVSIYYRTMVTAIENEKKFLQILLNNLQDGIIACDRNGIITVCNLALANICGNIKNILYTSLNEFFVLKPVNSETTISIEEHPLSLALQGEHIQGKEYIMVSANHTQRDVVINGQPIRNFAGEKIGAVLVIHDVTKIKETEKLKKEFVSIVSHELRTPLTSIFGSLSMLLDESVEKSPEELQTFLQVARKNTERLIRLINDILDVEKIEAGKMTFIFKEVNMQLLIEEAINEIKGLAEKNHIKVRTHYPEKEIKIKGDYDRLMQVLVNLLSNALKFSPTNDFVNVELQSKDQSIRVSVKDHGPGIPPEFQERIFRKFSQAENATTRSKQGTGLGLNISKGIVEKHQGTINFETSSQGTCFYFDLPINLKTDMTKELPVHKIESSNILICESNPDTAGLLQDFLNRHGYDSDIVTTAREARKLLNQNKYQVIAVDLVLQDEDGIKFIRELRHRALTAKIPIVVISTKVEEGQDKLKSSGFPIVDWIQKPIRKDHLHHLLDYIIEHYPRLPHILCVEDDPDISMIINKLFEGQARIDSARTLATAQQKINNNPYDLIILDLKLPDGIGTNLLPCINIETREIIPVVVFSAYELDQKYSHLVKKSLLKSKVSNEDLVKIIRSVMKQQANKPVEKI